MWKLIFKYRDGGKMTVTSGKKDIPLKQLAYYTKQYTNAASAVYQKYPKKDNPPDILW